MDIDFTDSEIREELARLGYKDVPEDKLVEFKKGKPHWSKTFKMKIH